MAEAGRALATKEVTLTASVITLTFNRVNALHRCLESLMKQSVDGSNFEVVLVDVSDEPVTSVVEAFPAVGFIAVGGARDPDLDAALRQKYGVIEHLRMTGRALLSTPRVFASPLIGEWVLRRLGGRFYRRFFPA